MEWGYREAAPLLLWYHRAAKQEHGLNGYGSQNLASMAEMMTKGEVIRHPGGGGRLSAADVAATNDNGGTQRAATTD